MNEKEFKQRAKEQTDAMYSLPAIRESLDWHGDVTVPADGEHDLRTVAAKVIFRLPRDVQDEIGEVIWFAISPGALGTLHNLHFPPPWCEEGFVFVHLSPDLARGTLAEAEFTIAHEIAHVVKRQFGGTGKEHEASEVQADALVKQWGFVKPENDLLEQLWPSEVVP